MSVKTLNNVTLKVKFSEASAHANITSQESIATSFGKLSKWYTDLVNVNAFSTMYGACSTAAATVAKTVACSSYKLVTGATITVKFTTTNTAASPTLNVNSTGAKAIYYRGAAISAGYLAANRTYMFRYNGTQYELVGDINTNTTYTAGSGLTLSNSQFKHSNSVTAKTSAGLVKVSYDATGHITGSTAVTKSDITALGIPSDNSDKKVTQTPSAYTGFRPVLLGYHYGTDPTTMIDTDVTEQAYVSKKLYMQPSTGALYTSANYYTTSGLLSTTNGVPTDSTDIPLIMHNGTNLWLGAKDGSNPHINGRVYVSSGYDTTTSKGNPTIYISVPKDDNTGRLENYPVLHSGNYTNYCTPTNIGAATSDHDHDSVYLKLTGGTIASGSFGPLTIKRNTSDNAAIKFENSTGVIGALAMSSGDGFFRRYNSDNSKSSIILDAENYKTYCTPANIGAATASHTHQYAGSASAGGAATSALKLTNASGDVVIGSATAPVYFKSGVPTKCTYTLGKSVPSDAVFTDTHYTTSLKVGNSATATANKSTTNGNTYLNLMDNTTVRDSHKIVGSGGTTVTSDASGTITIDSTTYTHPTYTAQTGKPTANQTPTFGTTFTISQVTSDATGHVTAMTDHTVKIPDTVFGGATASGAGSNGLVPAPASGDNTKFLKGDGTWGKPSMTIMTGASTSAAGTAGAVPAPAKGKQSSFLRGDGTWQTPTVAVMTKATASAAGTSGLVPAPGANKQNAFLRGDATWVNLENYVGMTQRPTTGGTKTYLMGTANEPSSAELAVKTICDTTVFLSGSADATTLTAPKFSGNGSSITDINAGHITAGTLASERLANSGATAGTYGTTENATLTPAGTFKVPKIVIDAKGRVTSAANVTLTLPTDKRVTQTPTSYTGFRPILLGYHYGTDPSTMVDAAVTDQAYVSSKLYMQPSTGALYTSANYYSAKGALISTTNGVPDGAVNIPMIYHNGTNLWIGADGGSTPQVLGSVYISAGYNNTTTKGNSTIYISVPNDDNTGRLENYPVLHSGNYTNYCTPANIGAAAVAHNHTNYIGAVAGDSDYYAMATPAGTTSAWIRTTEKGIIPFSAAASGSGTCALGTSTYAFASAYIDSVHGTADKADKIKIADTAATFTGNVLVAAKSTDNYKSAKMDTRLSVDNTTTLATLNIGTTIGDKIPGAIKLAGANGTSANIKIDTDSTGPDSILGTAVRTERGQLMQSDVIKLQDCTYTTANTDTRVQSTVSWIEVAYFEVPNTATNLVYPIKLDIAQSARGGVTTVNILFAEYGDATYTTGLAKASFIGAATTEAYMIRSKGSDGANRRIWYLFVKQSSASDNITTLGVYKPSTLTGIFAEASNYIHRLVYTDTSFTGMLTNISAGTQDTFDLATKLTVLNTFTVGQSTQWAATRVIEGMQVNGTANRFTYCTCSTAGATKAKTATCTGYKLITGATVTVKFSNTNTVNSPTLNISSTGAKVIYYRGKAVTANRFVKGGVYTFRYNGTQYDVVGDLNEEAADALLYSGSGSNEVTLTEAAEHFNTVTIQLMTSAGTNHIVTAQTSSPSGTYTWCPIVFDPPRSGTQQYVRFTTAYVYTLGTTLKVIASKTGQINVNNGESSVGSNILEFSVLNVWGHR